MSREEKEQKEQKKVVPDEELVTVDWEDYETPSFIDPGVKQHSGPDDGDEDVIDDVPKSKKMESKKNDEKPESILDDESEDESEEEPKNKPKAKRDKKGDDEEDITDDNDLDTRAPSSKGNSKSSPALVFAKFLNEKGVLSLDEEEFSKIKEVIEENGEETAFEYIFNKEVEKRVNDVRNSFDDDIREYLELRDVGIAPDIATKLIRDKNAIEQISENDLSGDGAEPLRREIIRMHLNNTTKMSSEEIEDYIDTLVDTGKDEAWAIKSLKAVKQHNKELIEQEKKRIQAEEEEMNRRIAETKELIKKTVMETNEILGNEVSASMKNKVIKLLTEPVGKDSEGNPVDGILAWLLQDPLKNRINLAYAIASGILDGKLNSIKKKVKSEIFEELEDVITNKSNMIGGVKTGTKKNMDNLEALKAMFDNEVNTF